MKYLSLIALMLSLTLTSCIYKMDIEQGNAIDQDKVDKLKIGMTKKQVKFLLGNPAIKDIFHKDEWHYLRTLKHDNGSITDKKTMILKFEHNILQQIQGHL